MKEALAILSTPFALVLAPLFDRFRWFQRWCDWIGNQLWNDY